MTQQLRLAGDLIADIHRDVKHSNYHIPDHVFETAQILADVVGSPDVAWAGGRSPSGIAVTCVYVADWLERGDDRLTQDRLCRVAPSTAMTLRKNYPEIPEVFIGNADPSDFESIGIGRFAVLSMCEDAQSRGVRWLDLDPTASGPNEFATLIDQQASHAD